LCALTASKASIFTCRTHGNASNSVVVSN
jgi:hypothetical protein